VKVIAGGAPAHRSVRAVSLSSGQALRMALQQFAGPYGFVVFVPAILLAALLFDQGSGYLALALSLALTALVIPWEEQGLGLHIAALAVFAAVSVPLVLVAEGLHSALEEAHQARRAQALLLAEMSHRTKQVRNDPVANRPTGAAVASRNQRGA
jgi:hypothetical protein